MIDSGILVPEKSKYDFDGIKSQKISGTKCKKRLESIKKCEDLLRKKKVTGKVRK